MNTFGERLREARKAKDLTQRQLADLIGAKHNSVSNWENNQNKPDPDTIEIICGVLNIEPNYLLSKDILSNAGNKKMIIPSVNSEKDLQTLVNKYMALDEKGKHTVNTILEMEYRRCSYLTPIAAHNDNAEDENEQQLIQEDLDEL